MQYQAKGDIIMKSFKNELISPEFLGVFTTSEKLSEKKTKRRIFFYYY